MRIDDADAIEILRRRAVELQIPQRVHTTSEIQERCLFPLLNEGFRVLGEGIALRAADIDVGVDVGVLDFRVIAADRCSMQKSWASKRC
jgi:hypothetical protein